MTPPPAPTTEQEIQTAIYQTTKTLNNACYNFIVNNGIPVIVNGVTYTVGATPLDQSNLNSMATSVLASISQAKPWSANTSYNPGSIIEYYGNYLITKAGGTSGSSEFTAPSEFQVGATDGTVTWYLFGCLVALAGGGSQWFTPQEFSSAYAQGMAYITDMRSVYHNLVNSLSTYQSVSQINDVQWPFSNVQQAMQFVAFGGTETTSTSGASA